LEDEGMGCIPFSPLAQGLLTNKYLNGIPADSRAASANGFLQADEVSAEKITQIVRLNEMATQRGQTLAQMALAWVLRHKQTTSVLIGASKVSQIEDAVGLLVNPNFSSEELATIDAVLVG
jgi:L-glyceraldehyde 3-phosphate reductase